MNWENVKAVVLLNRVVSFPQDSSDHLINIASFYCLCAIIQSNNVNRETRLFTKITIK
jgi:hypothetical protein